MSVLINTNPTVLFEDHNLNCQLNNTARNTNDVNEIIRLVDLGANMLSTNGEPWNHTPLHQACYHNRPVIVKSLLDLLNEKGLAKTNLSKHSNPCGRGGNGKPAELASIHPNVLNILNNFKIR